MIELEPGLSPTEANELQSICERIQDLGIQGVGKFNELGVLRGYDNYPVKLYSTTKTKRSDKISDNKIDQLFYLLNNLDYRSIRGLSKMTVSAPNQIGLVPPPIPPKVGG